MPSHVHGASGLDGADLPEATVPLRPETAIELQSSLLRAAASPVTLALTNLARPFLSSFLGVLEGLATESPLSWIFAAAARREVGVRAPETTPFRSRVARSRAASGGSSSSCVTATTSRASST